MASNEEVRIPLRYWVDEKKRRVIVAEASGDFVDVLFSFLTLPLGTIIRLGNTFEQHVQLGCINKLYQSVDHLDSDVFWNKVCKKMLHSPRNPLESSCQRLKVKVDDTEPTKYFMCHNCSKKGSEKLLVTSFSDVKCDCGSLMRKEIEMLEEPARDDGVYVKGKAMFLIYDNLTVRRSSPSESIKEPLKLGHKNLGNPIVEHLDRKKILSILKQALTSKTPLSDVLLGNTTSKRPVSFSRVIGSSHSKDYLQIKVMVSKPKNKILFVEADGDFADFLASFLSTPLGSIMNLKNDKLSCCLIPLAYILKLKNGKLSLGSIRNLYKSVKNLDPWWFTESSNKSLLNPKVASHFGCERNPLLKASQDDIGKYWYGLGEVKNEKGRVICEKKMISKKHDMLQEPKDIKLLDPRSSDRARKDGVGFMKRPCLFVVSDDLELSPMTTISSIPCSFMDDHQFTKLEEHLVKIRKSQALNLLRASLTSDKGAFTRSLSFLLWKWRFQRLIPFWGFLRRKKNEKEEKRKRRKIEKNNKLNDKKEKKKQDERAAETRKEKEEIKNNSVHKRKEEVKA